jgi:inhibitor of cysteine peptidase
MKRILGIVIIGTAVFLSACLRNISEPGSNDLPVSSEDTPDPKETLDPKKFVIGEAAYIEMIDIVFLESFPLQVHAIIKGNLPDGCTTIQRHEVNREKNTFSIKVFTQRPVDAICTQALVPFEYVVPLDVYGLHAGNYSVKAYNAFGEFTFSQDNVQSDKDACTLYPDCGDS